MTNPVERERKRVRNQKIARWFRLMRRFYMWLALVLAVIFVATLLSR